MIWSRVIDSHYLNVKETHTAQNSTEMLQKRFKVSKQFLSYTKTSLKHLRNIT